ncbi:MAG: ribosome maturation factor RimM [Candidatus Dormibacter sp.]
MTAGPQPDLRIGRILKAHGVRGGVRVESLTDFPDRFRPGRQVRVGDRSLTIARSSEAEGSLLITFVEVTDREQAAALTGLYLTVPLVDAHPLPAGRYYHFQLVGLQVIDSESGRVLGTVADVLSYPANDVLQVMGETGERLVPMVSSVIKRVALDEGTVTVNLPQETA